MKKFFHVSCTRRCIPIVAAALVCAAAATDVRAQIYDHLECFKIRDESTFRGAGVDLDAELAAFGLQSCTIKGRAKKICIPVSKAVTSIEDGSVIPDTSEELSLLRICYKLRCPASVAPSMLVSDQFGSRNVDSFKAVELCTPAVAGPPPTPTTTTSTTLPEDLDDDFAGASLDPSWSVLHPALATITVSGGALHLVPTAAGAPDIWYNAGEGPLVYKLVSGDFDVSAVMSTRNPSMPASPPPTEYRLAGILARDPASSPASSNTVHVAIGAGSSGQGTSYEYKSTNDSVSDWMATPTASPAGEVRLRRVGNTFDMFWRPDSISSWTNIHTFVRADMPAQLQVGLMVYSVDSPPSIEALFDSIDFE